MQVRKLIPTGVKKLIKKLLQVLLASRPTQCLAQFGDHVCLGHKASFSQQKAAIDRIAEAFVAEIRHTFSINCVIDVGTNRGQFGSSLRKAGYEGLILSVEPNREAFEILRSRTRKRITWSLTRRRTLIVVIHQLQDTTDLVPGTDMSQRAT